MEASATPPPPLDPGAPVPIIRTVGLTKVYGGGDAATHALRGVDAVIHRGELIAVMGPSGSGKSTFFNMIGGLDGPTGGRILIDEVDVAQLSAAELAFLRCRKIGYIFQQYNLVRYMTALENVTVPMAFAGVDPDAARGRGMALLETVGIAQRWDHRPVELSGGQQQRVAIARALANRPAILLADEPTANLDFATGQDVLDLLVRINRDAGVTVVCSTHDHRLLALCDRIMWIKDGRLDRVQEREDVRITVGSVAGEEP
ncbi:ABC transporter ATP-binding protein [Phycisphaera mikurensis]|uniref:Putative ABC transporter ATP-binding protein n=1 Tax=Phycisphaera mikurensis (strain NBRC 102666 / KCTC 22515 / FYK2301M01) TaxID=1142394 RepID=I0IA74_PHYMF|nr:ABC transporter ATP-binding protein [Phycisphaera mikurensis]MBB6441836.1 putative ABC transport system ATP-binding protein [Phycisphaera mikurensis]BAM02162.1 putative ABC transporter ATP-binding protein [Phycisphaera mikurensis NBRC 102666]